MKKQLPPLLNALNLYRLERGMGQAELAKRLGVVYQTVNRWFNGRTKPNDIHEFRIKRLLKERR